MKKILILILSGATIFAGSSCKKYLNVNTNPNSATSVQASQVIDEAIVYAAANRETFNEMGSEVGGYCVNAGGYGGFGSAWTYDYSTSDFANPWAQAYSMLENIQYVLTATANDPTQAYYNAMAQIMKAYEFEGLVDTYNDVPYAQALVGTTYLTPKYDSAAAVYQQLANILDSAIAEINANSGAVYANGADPLFGGNMTLWKQFANTIKLKLIVHASSVMTFSNMTFSSDGFLTSDAVVNPGYAAVSGKVNPTWNAWVVYYNGSSSDRAWVPSAYVFGFYNGVKLIDSARGAAIFHDWPNYVAYGQLGVTTGTQSDPGICGAWYSGLDTSSGTALGNAIGVEKDPGMGEPLMLAAESYFLQAEAYERGIFTSGLTDAQAFQAGILASFTYLEEGPDLTLAAGYTPATDVAAYLAANSGSYLVNYSLATTAAQKTEAIITQKYIANNWINTEEGWNEFRRTGYPVCATTALNNAYNSFASTQSQASTPNKLPTRVLYPNTEFNYNDANVPQGISPWGSQIFWAQ